ncbi:glycosyltransferase [Clostridium aestuarii]|uniref:Glycosyltransferase n=1 Tax=Clostridium aestuarii TaxID=338193 RepID=A0ABT4D3H4_9CLOT|nr:glycosyltransferase [Clostridium aestuarii]MCY6485791.1 glycosyltransferase [Clostridium aestuarii]
MKKVLFIAYYFPPLGWSGVQRSLKFVKYLRCFNWEPIVVTVKNSSFCIKDDSLFNDIPPDLKVIRIEELPSAKYTNDLTEQLKESMSHVLNMLPDSYYNFYENSFKNSFKTIRSLLALPDDQTLWGYNVLKKIESEVNFNNIDMIYSTSGPYSAHFIGYNLKQKHNIPWVADFRDEWTNYPGSNIDKNNIIYKIQEELETRILNFCDKVLTISPICKTNYINIFKLNTSKVQVITNGYDEEDFVNINISKKNDKFTIVYNGSLYPPRKPDTFLCAVNNLINKNLIPKDKISIKFIGTCTPDIYNDIFKNDIYHITQYLAYLSHKDSLQQTANADLLLLIIGSNPKVKCVYTGKVFEYIRLKKPILALSPSGSVVDELLNKTNCGKNIDFSDIPGIEGYIYQQYVNWTKNISINTNENEIKQFERKSLTSNLSTVFDEILSSYPQI